MNEPLLPFQRFQFEFGRRLRDPRGSPRPDGVPARRMAVYEELLFNNVTGFLDSCFPVASATLGERRWRRLARGFFRDWRCRTPYFREIPREFLDWLAVAESPTLPPWFRELLHYEWTELAVDVMVAERPAADPAGDLMDGQPVLAPALMNLAYAWPVHRIGPGYRPRKPRAVHLLVFRDGADEVRFVEISPSTALLVERLRAGDSGRCACLAVAADIGHARPEALLAAGAAALAQLREAGAILGAAP